MNSTAMNTPADNRTESVGNQKAVAAEPHPAAGQAELLARRAIDRHNFPEAAERIAQKVLDIWWRQAENHGWRMEGALIPSQRCFGKLCGLDGPQVSKALAWLVQKRVLDEIRAYKRTKGRPWGWYRLRPPEQWVVEERIAESQALTELEQWLDGLDPQQQEMLAPPASLDDLLVERFVERSARTAGYVESSPRPGVESVRAAGISPRVESEVESKPLTLTQLLSAGAAGEELVPADKVVSTDKVVPGDKVVCQTTISRFPMDTRARASIDPDRIIDSRKKLSRSDRSEELLNDTQRHAEDRLFGVVGEHERFGRSGEMFRRAARLIPDETLEVVSFAVEQKRLGRLKRSIGAYLNACLRSALEAHYAKQGRVRV